MRRLGPFEYQDLEEVTKWDSRSEVPREDGGGGIPGTMGVFPDAMGVRRKMAAEEIPSTMGVRRKMAAEGISDLIGVRRKMAAGDSGRDGRLEENGGGGFLV